MKVMSFEKKLNLETAKLIMMIGYFFIMGIVFIHFGLELPAIVSIIGTLSPGCISIEAITWRDDANKFFNSHFVLIMNAVGFILMFFTQMLAIKNGVYIKGFSSLTDILLLVATILGGVSCVLHIHLFKNRK